MKHYLLFRLYGPMAAWGDTAVGEFRPSQGHPSRTAVLGLLAAALGIRRDREEELLELDRSVQVAVRLDLPGELLRDYHTVQSPPAAALKGNWIKARKDEVAALKAYWAARNESAQASPISTRDYRADAGASVALQPVEDDPSRLHAWQHALRIPALPLYLGRKSCPLALPTDPVVVEASDLKAAFDRYPGCDEHLVAFGLRVGADVGDRRYFWEGEDHSLQTAMRMSYPRRDRLLSRRRWQFAARDEHQASHPREHDHTPDSES